MKKRFALTAMEKEVAKKIAIEMVVIATMWKTLPRSRNKDKRAWEDGLHTGQTSMILSLTHMVNDDQFSDLIDYLLETDKENEKRFGKKNWAEIKKRHKEVRASQKQ